MTNLINAGYPFVAREPGAVGLTRKQFRQCVATKQARDVLLGVYVDGRVPDTRELRARALGLVKPPHAVFYGSTVAWLMGVDTYRPRDRFDFVPQCVVPHGTGRCTSALVRCKEGYLPAADIIEINGLAVTTPVRTTADLLRTMYRPHALAAADSMAHAGLVSAAEVQDYLVRLRGYPGIVQGRTLADMIEPMTQSPGESWQRLRLIDAGFPRPHVQIVVTDRMGETLAILDMGYPERLIAAEYDGAGDHTSESDRERDYVRRAQLDERFGWRIAVARQNDIWGEDQSFELTVGSWLGLMPLPRMW